MEVPALNSVGMEYVLVNGRIVKDPEGLKKDVRPGEPISSAHALKTLAGL